MIEKAVKPQTRTWAPRTGMCIINPHTFAKPEKKRRFTETEQEKPPSIEELSSMLDIPQRDTSQAMATPGAKDVPLAPLPPTNP